MDSLIGQFPIGIAISIFYVVQVVRLGVCYNCTKLNAPNCYLPCFFLMMFNPSIALGYSVGVNQ